MTTTISRRHQRPICIVISNEGGDISDEMRDLTEQTFHPPMCGFAESFNLCVATAITLAYMKATLSSLAQKRLGKILLNKEEIVLPNYLGLMLLDFCGFH